MIHVFKVFGLLSIACSAPGTFPSQIYFLIIVVTGFIGSILLCLIRLRFPRFNKKGKQAVSISVFVNMVNFPEWSHINSCKSCTIQFWVKVNCGKGPSTNEITHIGGSAKR